MKTNTQKPIPQLPQLNPELKPYNTLSVHSIFQTIQGEGPFAGVPATFIRLGGCNLRCPQCDTEYTDGCEQWAPIELVKHLDDINSKKLIVITGGEPFRQDIEQLVWLLELAEYHVQIETNGTLAPISYDGINPTIVCSPKTHFVHPDLLPHIDAFKYVLDRNDMNLVDGLPIHALGHPVKNQIFRKPKDHPADVYLQPIDVQDEDENFLHQKAVVQSCMEHGYTLCLQIHKIIDVE